MVSEFPVKRPTAEEVVEAAKYLLENENQLEEQKNSSE
jgi:hypothetical protein